MKNIKFIDVFVRLVFAWVVFAFRLSTHYAYIKCG